MRTSFRAAVTIVAVALPTALAHAQSAPGRVLQVAPYAGYMLFGNYLEGPLGVSLSNASGPVYGTQAGLRLAPNVTLVGNLGYSSGDLRVGLPILGSLVVGSNTLVIYDGGLQLDLGTLGGRDGGRAVSPFVQGGVGGIHSTIEKSFVHATATSLTYNVGGGLDVALGRNVGLRLMAKDYIGKFDFKEALGYDIGSRTSHNVALTVGARLDF